MAASPDHSWSTLLGARSTSLGRDGDDTDSSSPVRRKFTSAVVGDCASARDPETAPLTHTCINCHLQVTSPVCPYSPGSAFSDDSASVMSVESCDGASTPPPPPPDPTPPSSAGSSPGQPELRLSPLQDPLHRHHHRGHRFRPKPETCTESSTQTERDFPPPPPPAARSESRASLASTTVPSDVCRICHCESEVGAPLISPCVCCGSLKYVHQACLQQWIKSADTKSCELCRYNFEMTTKIKPFRKWQKLEMTTVERRKIMCSVTFHIIAITCVIWSLYVLIDRTTEEIKQGILEWPFWTKLIVVAIGFTGGLVFMYVQCKMYVQLCRRWRAYNRVIFIQNCPKLTGQKIPLQPHMLDENGLPKDGITLVPPPPPPPSGVTTVMQETELL